MLHITHITNPLQPSKGRKDWDNPIHNGIVSFVSLPLGGGKKGGSNPLNVVLMVALVVATIYTGGAVGAAYPSAL